MHPPSSTKVGPGRLVLKRQARHARQARTFQQPVGSLSGFAAFTRAVETAAQGPSFYLARTHATFRRFLNMSGRIAWTCPLNGLKGLRLRESQLLSPADRFSVCVSDLPFHFCPLPFLAGFIAASLVCTQRDTGSYIRDVDFCRTGADRSVILWPALSS